MFKVISNGVKGLGALIGGSSSGSMPASTFTGETYGYRQFNSSDSSLNALYGSVYDEQRHIEAREDSAYQRMVRDMQKAGLNPWTGIASGGLSTSQTNAAESGFGSVLALLNYNAEIDKLVEKKDYDTVKGITNAVKLISPAMALGL